MQRGVVQRPEASWQVFRASWHGKASINVIILFAFKLYGFHGFLCGRRWQLKSFNWRPPTFSRQYCSTFRPTFELEPMILPVGDAKDQVTKASFWQGKRHAWEWYDAFQTSLMTAIWSGTMFATCCFRPNGLGRILTSFFSIASCTCGPMSGSQSHWHAHEWCQRNVPLRFSLVKTSSWQLCRHYRFWKQRLSASSPMEWIRQQMRQGGRLDLNALSIVVIGRH